MSDALTNDSADAVPRHQALARKYRPQKFAEIIGQETAVTILCNALKRDRMHHAFLLNGVRGIGKTTIARIIARAVNCTGRDPAETPEPCGQCESCRAIAAEASTDIVEMDAASHTGVDNIRESILESVKYRPVGSRFKVYIFDEVHMLSKHAFNALLKTLEEPPDYVKFIFATTEIDKVPPTIVSRCQHLELLRVSWQELREHFASVLTQEQISYEPEALLPIAEIADGSVRDGLSLLDLTIALADGKPLTHALVSDMLRLNDQSRIYQLLDLGFRGQTLEAQALLADSYSKGAPPESILRDLLTGVYWLTRLNLSPEIARDLSLSEHLRSQAAETAAKLDLPRLTRAWQILQQGARELKDSPVKQQSLEMLMIKLCHAAALPDPAALVRMLETENASGPTPASAVDAPVPMSPAAPVPHDDSKKKTPH